MRIKSIVDETFQDYKKPAMLISMCFCNWKCCIEQGIPISTCQNSAVANMETLEVSIESILDRYLNNPITSAVVIGGLEPFLQFEEILKFVMLFRRRSDDEIVIYTGYYPNEIEDKISVLKKYKNIIVKFGRFIPNSKTVYDDVLGIELQSENQYAKRIGG